MLPVLAIAAALQAPVTGPPTAPEDKAAGLAAMDFVMGCFLPLPAFRDVKDYAAQSEKLGTGLPPPGADWALGVHVDGVGGAGCRVRYTGPRAETVWQADHKFIVGTCALTEDTPGRASGACVATGDGQNGEPILTRRADVRLERSGSGATATVVASFTNVRP